MGDFQGGESRFTPLNASANFVCAQQYNTGSRSQRERLKREVIMKQTKKWFTLATANVLTASLLAFTSVSYADDTNPQNPPANTTILQQILAQITAFHQNTMDAIQKFFASNLSYDQLIQNRAALEKAGVWLVTDSKAPTDSDVQSNLSLNTQGYYEKIANGSNAVNSAINPSNPDSAKQFSASSIIDSYAIKEGSNEMNQATQYIKFLSGQANPLMPPAENMNTQAANSKISVQQYKAAIGTFNAAQSAALNTLYKALAARTVQPGLGKSAGIPGKSDASPLEVEQYMVTLPFTSDWSQKILTSASPSDLQKQQLFMLAGIQNLLFENRMQMEQLNINLAALILQSQQNSTRSGISDLRDQAVKSLR